MEDLIFDRTQEDIISDTKKAYHGESDLNRIEQWCRYLVSLLNKYNYNVEIETKTDWKRNDNYNVSTLNRIKDNVNKIKNAYFSKPDTPNIVLNKNTINIEDANTIEKILYDIDDLLKNMQSNLIYCGVANLAQNRVWQQRFRIPKTWVQFKNRTFKEYLDTDTLSMVATDNNKNLLTDTNILNLVQLDIQDDVYASVKGINESMKKIDDLVGCECDYYNLRNLINDSSFENNEWNDTNNNTAYSTAEKLFGNRSLYFSVGTTIVANIPVDRPIVGHKYYGRRYIKTNGDNQPADCRFEVYAGDGAGLNWVYAWNRGNYEQWGFDSELYEITEINYSEDTQTIIRCFNVNTTADCWIDGLMLIDLTECFGAGKEPSKEWCDNNIPYFDRTTTIKVRKERA